MSRQVKKSKIAKSEKSFTFLVTVSFDMQHTFSQHEVQQAEEGRQNDFEPKDEVIAELEHELKEFLSKQYPIDNIEAFVDFDSLLGVHTMRQSKKLSRKPSCKPTHKNSQ